MPISNHPTRKLIKSANKTTINLNILSDVPQRGEKMNDFEKSCRSEKENFNVHQLSPKNGSNTNVATRVCEKEFFYENVPEEQLDPKSHPSNCQEIVIPDREQVYDIIPDWQPKLNDTFNEQNIVIPEREQVYEDVPEWESQLKVQSLKKKRAKPISDKEQAFRNFIPQFKGTCQSKLLHSKSKALQMNVTCQRKHKRNFPITIPETATGKYKTDLRASSSTKIQNTTSGSLKPQQSSGSASYATQNCPVLLRSRIYVVEKAAPPKSKPSAVERQKLKTLSSEHIEYCKNMCYDHLYKLSFLTGVLATDSTGEKTKLSSPKCSEKNCDENSFNVRGKKAYATVPCTKYPDIRKFSKKTHGSFDCIGESTRCPLSYTKCTEACQVVSEEICVINKEKLRNPQEEGAFPIDKEKCKYRHQKCFQTNIIESPKLHRRLSSTDTIHPECKRNFKEKNFSTKETFKKTDTSHLNIKGGNFFSTTSKEHKSKVIFTEFAKMQKPLKLKTNDSSVNTRKCTGKTNTKREVEHRRVAHTYGEQSSRTIYSNSQNATLCSKRTLENQVEKKDISDHFKKMLKIPSKIIKENTKKMLSPNNRTKPKSSSQYASETLQADPANSKQEIKTNKQRSSSKVIKIKEASQIPKLLNVDQEHITASSMTTVKKSSPLKEFSQLKKPIDEEKVPVNSSFGKAGTSKTSLTETISKFCQRFSPKRSPIKEDSEERKLLSSSSSESDRDLNKVTVKRKSLLPTARSKTNNRVKNVLTYFSQNSGEKDLTEPLFNEEENESVVSCEVNKIDSVINEEQPLLFKDTLSCFHKNGNKVSISCNVHLVTPSVLTDYIQTEDSTSDEYSSIPDTEDFPRKYF